MYFTLQMQQRFIELHPRTRLKLKNIVLESYKDGAYRVSRRIQSVLLNSEGNSSGNVARIVGASREKVSEWLKIYAHQGIDGLMEGRRTGRPSKITATDEVKVGQFGRLAGIPGPLHTV